MSDHRLASFTEKTPAEILRCWAKAYREGPRDLRFPSDPDAEFFPVDMDAAADRLEALTAEVERNKRGWDQAFRVGISHQEEAARLRTELAQAREALKHCDYLAGPAGPPNELEALEQIVATIAAALTPHEPGGKA